MLFVAQLWKYNGQRLESKQGDWMYMEETWILPTKTSKMGLAKLFSYQKKKETDNEGQAITNSLGHLIAYPDSEGIHLKL